jgi:hypothetical protein
VTIRRSLGALNRLSTCIAAHTLPNMNMRSQTRQLKARNSKQPYYLALKASSGGSAYLTASVKAHMIAVDIGLPALHIRSTLTNK